MNARTALLSLLLLPALLAADDAPKPAIKNPAAVAALQKRDAAADQAIWAYDTACRETEKQLITDLDAADKVARNSGSLDDALAIRAARKDSEARLAAVPKSPDAHAFMNRQTQNALAQRLENTKWSNGNGTSFVILNNGKIEDGRFKGSWTPIAENAVMAVFEAPDGEFVNFYRFDPSLKNFNAMHGHLGDPVEGKRNVPAAEDTPKVPMKSAAAGAATRKHDVAAKAALSDYDRAMTAAEKQLISDLNAAEKAATKSDSLDEAIAIRGARKDAEARLVELPKLTNAHPSSARQVQDTLFQRVSNTKWDVTGGQVRFLPDGGVEDHGPWTAYWAPIADNAILTYIKASDSEGAQLIRFDPGLTTFKSIRCHLGEPWEGKRLPQ